MINGILNKEIQNKLNQFVKNRNWELFHTPENLAKAILIESSELLKNYLWGNSWQMKQTIKKNTEEEFADILIYCFYFAQKMKIDILKVVQEKIKENERKYKENKCKSVKKN